MTEAEFGAYRRLEMLQDSLARQVGSCWRGLRDISHLPLSPPLLADVETCLRSKDGTAIGGGLYFLQGLLIERSADALPPEFLRFLVVRIEELLDHPEEAVAHKAIAWYALLRAQYSRYRERMLRALASADAQTRKLALRFYETYARPREIEPLLRFSVDGAATQLRPNGTWRFVLRDRALERIEEQLDMSFARVVVSEPFRGMTVSWYDWSALRDWWAQSALRVGQDGHAPARVASSAGD